jgi:parvulin-like peptidyl-prolyl isomerase
LLPRSVEVQVISRAIHPQDDPQTRQEAYLIMQEAYERLRKGDDFVRVAKQYAQRGGATTDNIFLQDGWDHTALISALKEGEFTPVLEVPSGYAIYKIIKFHPAEQLIYGKLPMWLKRVAFQERLASLIEQKK